MKSQSMRHACLIPVLMLVFSLAAKASAPPRNYLQEGMQALAQRQYKLAEAYFKISVLEKPDDAGAHYQYANALVVNKRHNAAIEEYQKSYALDPFGPVSGYCRKALLTYKQKRPEVEVPSEEPISAASRIGAKDLKSTKQDAIHLQAEHEKLKHEQIGESMSKEMVKTGDSRAGKIIETAKTEADRAINDFVPIPKSIFPYKTLDEYQRAQADKIKRDAEEYAKMERSIAAEKADAYKRWSKQRQSDLDQSASNLSGLLHSKTLPGSAKLREEGTGFYVRNYQVDNGPLREVHRSVARIIQNPVPLHSTTEPNKQDQTPPVNGSSSETVSGDNKPVSTVRGAILK